MRSEPLIIQDLAGPKEGERILRLDGPILLSNLFDFQSKVRTDTSRALIIDFTKVPYVDSAGIGALVGAYVNRQKEAGRSLLLVGVNQRIRQALQVTHVEQFFQFTDALAAS
ncbi:MAG TPA: STAS domain-containing protein [Terriglobales bacterium]|nr:STAS domain-containing protein [Terriglobales bacterium]